MLPTFRHLLKMLSTFDAIFLVFTLSLFCISAWSSYYHLYIRHVHPLLILRTHRQGDPRGLGLHFVDFTLHLLKLSLATCGLLVPKHVSVSRQF